LMSLLVLTHCGVSSRPLGLRTARPIENHCDYSSHLKHLLPQESPCFSSASISLLTTDCGSSKIKTSYNFTSPGEWRAVTPRKYKPIFFVRGKSCRSIPCPAGIERIRRHQGVIFSRKS